MAWFLLLVMLTVCAAASQDLSGKMFTFPQETNTAHVRMSTSREDLRAVSVCLRTFTDQSRDHALFSLATPSKTNDFLIYRGVANNEIHMLVRNNFIAFKGLDFKPNTWHSICSTWDSVSGLVQVWLDGKPSSRRYITSGSSINGPIVIVFGQDQDTHGGGFDIKQSFVGMMSDVHMWNYILSPCQIQSYTQELYFTAGNVLNWRALSFQTNGRVLIENKQDCN
uniref:C-reactive protein-like n=1 Tax=Semicossyphus pulcher TaxID=241346 RepID=UPI0037E944A4